VVEEREGRELEIHGQERERGGEIKEIG